MLTLINIDWIIREDIRTNHRRGKHGGHGVFRGLRLKNFLRRPTMVGEIFKLPNLLTFVLVCPPPPPHTFKFGFAPHESVLARLPIEASYEDM